MEPESCFSRSCDGLGRRASLRPGRSHGRLHARSTSCLQRDDRIYLPGHAVRSTSLLLRAGVEGASQDARRRGARTPACGDGRSPHGQGDLCLRTDPRLHGAAALALLAHIEDLIEQGRVETEGPPSLAAHTGWRDAVGSLKRAMRGRKPRALSNRPRSPEARRRGRAGTPRRTWLPCRGHGGRSAKPRADRRRSFPPLRAI